MWLPVSALTTTYNRNVQLNYNEQLGANCDSRYCKFNKAIHSYLSKSNSPANKFNKNKRNCLKEATMSTVQSASNHVNALESANTLDSDANTNSTANTNSIDKPVPNSKAIDKLDNKSNKRLEDRCEEMKKVVDNESSKEEYDENETNKLDNKEKVEKLEKIDDKIESNVDANNNLCDKSIVKDNECNNDKSDLKGNKDEKSKNNKDNATCSVLSTTTLNNNYNTTKVATSYYVYSNGCAMETNSNNKRSANKSQIQDSSNIPSQQTSTYTTHALNHPTAHLNATPYTIYTTGHYSINGQPTILSIPPNTAPAAIMNQNQPLGQQMNSQHSHLHHNQYHHSNQTHNSNHHQHYHNIQQQQPVQQSNYHSQSNYNQKNSIKNNSNLIKSSSSSVSTASSSSNNSNNHCNNLAKSSSSSIINSTTYTSTYTNINPNNNNNPPTSNQLQTKCNLNNNNLESIPAHHQQSHYHSGYYNHYNGVLDPKDTNSITKTLRKIFVGGLPYHSTGKIIENNLLFIFFFLSKRYLLFFLIR